MNVTDASHADRRSGIGAVIHSHPTWLPQTETWLHAIVREQEESGLAVHVVCERLENLDQFSVSNLHSVSTAGPIRSRAYRLLRKLRLRRSFGPLLQVGRRVHPALVHSHFGNVGWGNLDAVRRLRVPHVVTFYGLDVNMLPRQQVWRTRYRRLFASADLFLCEGPFMAESLHRLGCPREKTRVQHLGVRVGAIPFQPRVWRADEPLRVLIAATFREKKGIPDALEVIARLRRSLRVETTIVGDATPEPRSLREKERILQTANALGLDVRMLGFQPSAVLWAEAFRHHLFLSPSRTATDGDTEGGAPVSIIEMAASGMPVVSTTHCDIPEVMRPVAARFLAPEGDVETLVSIVRRMTDDWDALTAPLASLRRYVEAEFDLERQGERLRDLYRSVLEHDRRIR